MLDFTGVKCPVCGVPFGKDDDIVVCPECGAPYHRACYQQKGSCIFTDLHPQGEEWAPPAPPVAPPTAEIKDQECPVCGTLNGHSAIFCNRCGASLLGEPEQHANRVRQEQQNTPPYSGAQNGYGTPPGNYGVPFGAVPRFTFDPMGGVSPVEPLDNDVTYGEVSKLVRQNTNYYMPVFRYIRQTGRNKFNFSAFLFSGGWLLYRKQYRSGAIATAISFALYLLYLLSYWLIAWPTMVTAAAQAGYPISVETAAALTQEQILAISQVIALDPANALRFFLPYLFLAGIFVLMLVVGLRGNRMYLNHCVCTVRNIKFLSEDGDDPERVLISKGGVNTPVVICVAACFFILQNVLPLLLI